ncbi:hypothetical protein Q1695_001856 [Nippostrongylus brasiliensis]|nr:hypothetical protein Q1695_001856 [Nippostrongylus brasiliensis]
MIKYSTSTSSLDFSARLALLPSSTGKPIKLNEFPHGYRFTSHVVNFAVKMKISAEQWGENRYCVRIYLAMDE